MKKTTLFLLVGLLLGGLALLILFSLPYDSLKVLADRLASDGEMESFTVDRYNTLGSLRYLGLALILMGVAGWAFRRELTSALGRLSQFFKHQFRCLLDDSRAFFKPGGAERWPWMLVWGFTLLSALNKIPLLGKPVGHDEAYSYIAFASRPLMYVLRDYHLPNNHILHTILVHFSTQALGNDPWMVRLPAFLAGILLVPAGYAAGRALFNRNAGLAAAGVLATLPVISNFATSGRGYTLIMLLSLVLITLGAQGLRQKNRLNWLFFSLAAALGLYTIPIFLYPLGSIGTWLGLNWLAGGTRGAYGKGYWKYLLVSAVLAGLLTLLLYTPVFLYSGIGALTGNTFVQPISWGDFYPNVAARLALTFRDWGEGVSPWMWWVIVIGAAGGLALHKQTARAKVPIAAGFFLWMAVILHYQRVAPESRVWLFALPFLVLYFGSGLSGLFEMLNPPAKRAGGQSRLGAADFALLLVLASLAVWSIGMSKNGFDRARSGITGGNELAVQYLTSEIREGDIILTSIEEGPAIWYYARRYSIGDEHLFKPEERTFQRAWIIYNPAVGQDRASVIEAAYPAGAQINLDTARLMMDHTSARVEIAERK